MLVLSRNIANELATNCKVPWFKSEICDCTDKADDVLIVKRALRLLANGSYRMFEFA